MRIMNLVLLFNLSAMETTMLARAQRCLTMNRSVTSTPSYKAKKMRLLNWHKKTEDSRLKRQASSNSNQLSNQTTRLFRTKFKRCLNKRRRTKHRSKPWCNLWITTNNRLKLLQMSFSLIRGVSPLFNEKSNLTLPISTKQHKTKRSPWTRTI
jgi:hypothetical protein